MAVLKMPWKPCAWSLQLPNEALFTRYHEAVLEKARDHVSLIHENQYLRQQVAGNRKPHTL